MLVQLHNGLQKSEQPVTQLAAYDDFGNLINFVVEVGPRSYVCCNFGDPDFHKMAAELHIALLKPPG